MTDSEFLEYFPLDLRVQAITTVINGMFSSNSATRDELERSRRRSIAQAAKSLGEPQYKILIALITGLRLTSPDQLNSLVRQALNGIPDELDSRLGQINPQRTKRNVFSNLQGG